MRTSHHAHPPRQRFFAQLWSFSGAAIQIASSAGPALRDDDAAPPAKPAAPLTLDQLASDQLKMIVDLGWSPDDKTALARDNYDRFIFNWSEAS